MQLGWSRPCSDAGTGHDGQSLSCRAAPNLELSGVIETGAAFSSCSGCPRPAQRLPLRFIPQRREPNCPLSCFSTLHLHSRHLKGRGKHRFRTQPKQIRCVLCPAGAQIWVLGARTYVPPTRGIAPSRCLRTTGRVSRVAALYSAFQSGPALLRC